jgi:heme A synthase
MIKTIHSLWAYVVLIILIFAVINAVKGFSSKKEFTAKDLRISLFALIAAHIQLLIGFVVYYLSDFYLSMRSAGMGEVMKNSELRKILIEHPLVAIIAIVLITIGFSKHKKQATDTAKFKTIAIYYGIALLLILSRIPWTQWLSSN